MQSTGRVAKLEQRYQQNDLWGIGISDQKPLAHSGCSLEGRLNFIFGSPNWFNNYYFLTIMNGIQMTWTMYLLVRMKRRLISNDLYPL